MTFVSDSLTVDSALDAFTQHSMPDEMTDQGDDSLTQDSAPDALTPHSVPVVVGLDWERDGWRVSEAGAPCRRVSRDDLLTERFDDADYVVVEQAHMRERDVYSVAQVYWPDELRRLPFRDKIRLFPGMPGQLAKAARDVGNIEREADGSPRLYREGTDDKPYFITKPLKDKDAETMAQYAAAHPERLASWKPLRLVDEDPARRLWEARDALRDDLRDALNPLRTAWNAKGIAERYALPEVDRFCALLGANFDRLPTGVKEQFGISRVKCVKKDGTPTKQAAIGYGVRVERMAAALTVYLAVYTREGALRRRPDGGFIGVRFILDAIGMSNSYRPNMARSQLTHHGMRHFKGGRDGGARSEYMRNLRHLIQVLRDADDSDSLIRDSALDALTTHSVPVVGTILQAGDSLTVDSALDALTAHSVPGLQLAKEIM